MLQHVSVHGSISAALTLSSSIPYERDGLLEVLQPKMIRRVHLEEKLARAGGLSCLANRRGSAHQAIQATQETAITLVLPRQCLRATPPSSATRTVEPPVVANAKEGVSGDDIIRQGQLTQSRPGVETGRITRRDGIQPLPIG